MKQAFYVSLVRGLQGCYVKILANDEEVVRKHCLEYYGRLWCSIYSRTDMVAMKSKGYHINVINDEK